MSYRNAIQFHFQIPLNLTYTNIKVEDMLKDNVILKKKSANLVKQV